MWRSRGRTRCGARDITYVPLRHGFMYLMAVMDWYSRYVLSWRLSNTLDGELLRGGAWRRRWPRAGRRSSTRDQGAQFTAAAFTARLEAAGVAISMDGRGRALDNVFIERLWRSVKYEEVYLRDYADGWEAEASLARTSAFTTTSGFTRRWAIARRPRCTPRGATDKSWEFIETGGARRENRGPGLAQDERRREETTLDTSEIGHSGGASLN